MTGYCCANRFAWNCWCAIWRRRLTCRTTERGCCTSHQETAGGDWRCRSRKRTRDGCFFHGIIQVFSQQKCGSSATAISIWKVFSRPSHKSVTHSCFLYVHKPRRIVEAGFHFESFQEVCTAVQRGTSRKVSHSWRRRQATPVIVLDKIYLNPWKNKWQTQWQSLEFLGESHTWGSQRLIFNVSTRNETAYDALRIFRLVGYCKMLTYATSRDGGRASVKVYNLGILLVKRFWKYDKIKQKHRTGWSTHPRIFLCCRTFVPLLSTGFIALVGHMWTLRFVVY